MALSVRFELNEQDKTLLGALAKRNGDASMSAILRRLIREEAKRSGIQIEADIEAESHADGTALRLA